MHHHTYRQQPRYYDNTNSNLLQTNALFTLTAQRYLVGLIYRTELNDEIDRINKTIPSNST